MSDHADPQPDARQRFYEANLARYETELGKATRIRAWTHDFAEARIAEARYSDDLDQVIDGVRMVFGDGLAAELTRAAEKIRSELSEAHWQHHQSLERERLLEDFARWLSDGAHDDRGDHHARIHALIDEFTELEMRYWFVIDVLKGMALADDAPKTTRRQLVERAIATLDTVGEGKTDVGVNEIRSHVRRGGRQPRHGTSWPAPY